MALTSTNELTVITHYWNKRSWFNNSTNTTTIIKVPAASPIPPP